MKTPKNKKPFVLKAVIFDKDGVLMLTETIYHKAYQDILAQFGIKKEYTWDMHRKRNGMPTAETFFYLKKEFGFKISLGDFLPVYRNRYTELMQDGLVVPDGVHELLDSLKMANIPVAIATGGSRESTDMTLEKTGLAEYFDIVITSSDVANGKPDPEIFLLAAKRLGIKAHNCLVIGDSVNDILGGKAAGMKVIGLIDRSYSRDTALAVPDIEVVSMKEITIEMMKEL